jgi:hypothetical protein
VTGTVTDPTGAVVPTADVALLNPATNTSYRTQTNAVGGFTFANLPPGDYKVTITVPGFRTVVLTLKVEVAKSALADVVLEVGPVAEKIEVTAGARAELQTLDSSVGAVLVNSEILRLPTVQRRASELVYLQVATTPIAGTGAAVGGSVAGARTDQNTATLDGILITDVVLGGEIGGNVSMAILPVDAIEEFRGTVSNPNEAMARSSGGHFSFVTRRGTNDWHGSASWYHQNDNLNANSWTRNRLGQANPELKDNRFNFRLGGPVFKDKTFFFGFYEGRRFTSGVDGVRVGISETLRNGILRFLDGTGNVVSYDLKTSTLCGSTNSSPCDPRGLGMSPVIQQYFTLYPVGNDPSASTTLYGGAADGLNTVGIRGPAGTPTLNDTALFRLDHNITSKWRLFGNYMYSRQRVVDSFQIDFNPAVTGGALLKSTAGFPVDVNLVTLGVAGQVTPTLTYDFRFGYNRQQFAFDRTPPQTLVSGAGLPLDLAGVTLDDPGDPRAFNPSRTGTKIWQFSNSLVWVKASHVANAGVNYQLFSSRHQRLKKATYPIIPVAAIGANVFTTIPATQRPPTCVGAQANCLRAGDVARWNQLYASVLGIWDNMQAATPRDAAGNPLGIVPLTNDDRWHHVEFTGGDTWRFRPSLTLSYGLNVTVETPLHEVNGLQFFIVDNNTGEPIQPRQLLAMKAAAAAQGQTYNEQIAYVPAESLGRNIYPTVFVASPRASGAWNPSFRSGLLKTVFGDRKTVIRGGYSLLFQNVVGVWPEIMAVIGNELMADTIAVLAPTCDVAGTPGAGCVPGVSPFRVGVDGPAFVPTPGPRALPFVPNARNTLTKTPFGVLGGFAINPDFGVGRVHGVDLTLQREIPGNMIVEMGWLGRWGRNLTAVVNINAPPVNLRDMSGVSNQIFAEAFDALATELRRGVLPTAVTPQPWFENIFGAGGTQTVASRATSAIIDGRIGQLFLNTIDPMLQTKGLPTVLNQQFDAIRFNGNGGWSNYQAFFATLRKSPSHGVSLNLNWTWSHCLDVGGRNEDGLGSQGTNPYDFGFDYGDCIYDRRHVVQAYGIYELPFRKSNRLLGGWYSAYIFTAHTGLPLFMSQGGDILGSFGVESVPTTGPVSGSTGVHGGVTGSGGVGTAGNPATGGTGLNLFADPEAVFKKLRPFLLSQDHRNNRGSFRGMGYWNLDFSVGKRTKVTEKVSATLAFDFFNLFNHTNFATPGGTPGVQSILSPASFGVISTEITGTPSSGDINVGPRRLQFSFRVEF